MRLEHIDKLKGMAIILVVMGHIAEHSLGILNSPFNFFYGSFHMPLFMFLSGLFAMKSFKTWNNSEIYEFLRNKIQRILLPFFVVGGFYSLICYHDFSVFYPGNGGYWFLPALFYCMFIEMFINKVLSTISLNLLLDICSHIVLWSILCVSYFTLRPPIPYYLAFIKMYPFFIFGVFYTKYSQLSNSINESKLLFTISCIAYIILIPFLRNVSINLTGLFAIIIYMQMFMIYNTKIPHLLAIIGRSSLAIYIFHWFLLPSQLHLGKILMLAPAQEGILYNGNFILLLTISLIIALAICFACILIEKVIIHSKWLALLIFGSTK